MNALEIIFFFYYFFLLLLEWAHLPVHSPSFKLIGGRGGKSLTTPDGFQVSGNMIG